MVLSGVRVPCISLTLNNNIMNNKITKHSYNNDFDVEKIVKNKVPTKSEILEEMELHNNDEVGIDNQWTYEDAEYYLLLSDKYYYK